MVGGGCAPDFSARNPLKNRTMFQARNENNDKKGNGLGVFTMPGKGAQAVK